MQPNLSRFTVASIIRILDKAFKGFFFPPAAWLGLILPVMLMRISGLTQTIYTGLYWFIQYIYSVYFTTAH